MSKFGTEEYRHNMSIALKGRIITWGTKISEAKKGFKFSEESKEKMRLSHLGKKKNPNAYSFPKGETHPNWIGDEVGYSGLHTWIKYNFIRPNNCENCETDKIYSRFGNWHNISGKYLRKRDDWEFLCAKCHRLSHKKELVRRLKF